MCGIFGLINVNGKPTQNAIELWDEVVRSLAVYSTERGLDSSGVARMDADGTLDWTKDVGPAWTLFGRPDWQRVVTPNSETFALIGHTRLATHGGITRDNSHPFVFDLPNGKLCGVHNGVIQNSALLTPTVTPHEVDSYNLFDAMARQLDAWPAVWRKTIGSVAIAALRTDDRTITLARNHNPIALAAIKELGVVAFASTVKILETALAACSIIVKARPMPEFSSIVHRVGARKSTIATWSSPIAQTIDKKAARRARKQSQKQYHGDKNGKVITARSVEGERWTQCGACLTWAPAKWMTDQNGTDVCSRCAPYYQTRSWGPSNRSHNENEGQYAL